MPILWCSEVALWPAIAPVAVLLGAAIADFCIGDPWQWPHPVQGMGWVIQRYQTWVFRHLASPLGQRWAGVGLGLGLPLLSGAIAAGIVTLAARISAIAAVAIAGGMLASCLAGRSLRDAAEDVLRPLAQGDVPTARSQLSRYVGRDTDDLDRDEILRAVTETVSENATDGVLAPLFYGLLGLMVSPAVGVAAAIAYKALSTLDSMVGYIAPPYTHLGWFSAKAEDCATWLPCRLTVLTIAALSGRLGHVLALCRRDAKADPSPNAGWSECAYAAALGVQLGGENRYRGMVKVKPSLGDRDHPITPDTVRHALGLTRWAVLLWLAIGCFGLIGRYPLHCG
ncbi:MAG: cobalamin biosynthesis protein CobD [Leptolyngbyaceae cyanobacterium T60_A2020_046]|nr:cobalamin biosynthesis protein CobD [Leptolyngbyaceae cyanobacterium T60_A2020_046]